MLYKNRPRNLIINGNFHYSQRRGSASTALADGVPAYVMDRWRMSSTNGTHNIDRSADAPNERSQFALYMQASYTGANHEIQAEQRIESIFTRQIRGKLSYGFWVKSGSATQIRVVINTPDAENNWSSTTTAYNHTFPITANNTWQYISMAGLARPAGYANGISMRIEYELMSVLSSQVHLLSQVALFESEIALPYELAAETVEDELPLCERYYEKSYDINTAPGTATDNGVTLARTGGAGNVPAVLVYKTRKRVTPTVVVYSPTTGAANAMRNDNALADITGVTYGTYGVGAGQTHTTMNVSAPANHLVRWQWTADAEL